MNELKGLSKILTNEYLGQNTWCYTIGDEDWSWGPVVKEWPDFVRVIEKYTPERRVIITAGAHVGLYAYGYAPMFTTVYAFEPNPLHFYCLVNNVQFPNVIKIQAAVGANTSFGAVQGNALTACVTEETLHQPFIPVMRIDVFDFPVVDVIQLDVEGYELRALQGAIHTINTHKPLLIIENGHHQEIVDFLAPLGYTIVERLQWDTVWKWGVGDEPKVS